MSQNHKDHCSCPTSQRRYNGICRCSKDGRFYEIYQCLVCKKNKYLPYSGAIDTVEYRNR